MRSGSVRRDGSEGYGGKRSLRVGGSQENHCRDGTGFPKICFIDENGKLTGFDVELVREIDQRLEEYEFEFQTQEISNLLLSRLDAADLEKNGVNGYFLIRKKCTP